MRVLVTAVAILCAPHATMADDIQKVIDEAIAGSDANLNKIQAGKAVYAVEVQRFRGSRSGREALEFEVLFNGPQMRMNSEKKRVIYGNETATTFETKNLGLMGQFPASSFSAIIRRRQIVEPPPFYPRLLSPSDAGSLGASLRRLKGNKEWTIDAKREGQKLIFTLQSDEQEAKTEYIVDPSSGYGITQARTWALTSSKEEPYSTFIAEYEKANNGAFVVGHLHTEEMIAPAPGSFEKDFVKTVTLKSIDLLHPPDATVFTVDGLGLPAGATIQDKVNGTTHPYARQAVPEKAIGEVNDDGSSGASRPFVLAGAVLVILLLIIIWRTYAKRG